MSTLFRKVLSMVLFILVVSMLFSLFISLFPILLVLLVFVIIYSSLFGSRRYYVYRSRSKPMHEQEPAKQFSSLGASSCPKQVEVQVKDI